MTDQELHVGTLVNCSCPRYLVAARVEGHIWRRHDGRPAFPPAAQHVRLHIWHREGCPATSGEACDHLGARNDYVRTEGGMDLYRCSRCGGERNAVELAEEMRVLSEAVS